ncbi:MAG: FHA domain-containing protein [Planctomycetes bacterium]|nr:FHA domain-containing protein [Planctomycetota bacterium]
MPLFICRHSEKGVRWAVEIGDDVDPILIGRSREAQLCIPDVSVSKRHARIEKRAGGRHRFRDLKSRNGTRVNEFLLEEGPLEDGDELKVGKIAIRFFRERPAAVDALEIAAPEAAERLLRLFEEPSEGREASEPPAPEPSAGRDPVDASLMAETIVADHPVVERPPEDSLEAGGRDASQPPREERPAASRPGLWPERPPAVGAKRRGRLLLEDDTPLADVLSEAERDLARRLSRRPLAPPPSRPGVGSPAVLVIAGAVLIALGFALGWLVRGWVPAGSPPEPSRPSGGAAPGAPSAASSAPSGSAPGAAAALEGAAEDSSSNAAAPAAWWTLLEGSPADLSDPESSRRALYRLCLDLLGRPPVRDELRRWLPLPHEERWRQVSQAARDGEAGGRDPLPTGAAEVFERIFGRAPLPGEVERLVAVAAVRGVEPGQAIASSQLYASSRLVRARGRNRWARSLWVDVLDRIPDEKNVETLLGALEQTGDERELVRVLVYSAHAKVGPQDADLALAEWIRETFARFLLRFPTQAEERQALEEIQRSPEGWRDVVQSLALRPDYSQY